MTKRAAFLTGTVGNPYRPHPRTHIATQAEGLRMAEQAAARRVGLQRCRACLIDVLASRQHTLHQSVMYITADSSRPAAGHSADKIISAEEVSSDS